MKLLILPDIHGRKFWCEPCTNIDQYDKVIFLGDYLDPYEFENITVEQSIDNFRDIVKFAKDNPKVVLILGNHDMPYFSQTYYNFDHRNHCRHSKLFHEIISEIFEEHKDLFKIAHVEDNTLFTHAGCLSAWIDYVFEEKYTKGLDLNVLCTDLNSLLNSKEGLLNLFMISSIRYGWDPFGSCIWANVTETYWDSANMLDENAPQYAIYKVRQVFGHTLQAFEDKDKKIIYGKPIEFRNCKMLDNACAYELDTETFTIKNLTKQ